MATTAKVQLVTVVPAEMLKGSTVLPIPSPLPSNVARATELAVGWYPSRYFYAGRAHSQFGDAALAYAPNVETSHTGHAGPFDSGGVYAGYIEPLRSLPNDQLASAAADLLRTTTVSLALWRNEFEDFLARYFQGKSYFTDRPNFGPTPVPNHPVSDARNTDWRAWTWEVRFYEEHSIVEDLNRWACSPMLEEYLCGRVRDGDPNEPDVAFFQELLLVPYTAGEYFCEELESLLHGP